jgi:hypothetical protein
MSSKSATSASPSGIVAVEPSIRGSVSSVSDGSPGVPSPEEAGGAVVDSEAGGAVVDSEAGGAVDSSGGGAAFPQEADKTAQTQIQVKNFFM